MSPRTIQEVLDQFAAAELHITTVNGHHEALCPRCDGTVTISDDAGRVSLACSKHCDPSKIATSLSTRAGATAKPSAAKAASSTGQQDPPAARERDVEVGRATRELNELLELPEAKSVTGARIFGDGPEAAIYIELADGSEISLTARDMARPAALMTALAIGPGVRPKLNQARALDAVVLVKTLARHIRTMCETDRAIEWGVSFLQAATTLDLDLGDQAERWGAFSRLHGTNPKAEHRAKNVSIATASIVLRHLDGMRLVRCGWFEEYVRTIDPRVTPAGLSVQMQRAGWERRGSEGRWKATCPGRPGQLNWAFWHVPPDWEDRGEGVAVTAGTEIPRTYARTHVEAVTSRNRVGQGEIIENAEGEQR